MRVKRNNRTVSVKVFTGRDLIEKLYSEGWEIEQREYGLKDTAKSIYKIFKNRGKSIKKLYDENVPETIKSIKKSRIIKGLKERKQEKERINKRLEISVNNKIKNLNKPSTNNKIFKGEVDNPNAKDELKSIAKSRKIEVSQGKENRHLSKSDYKEIAKKIEDPKKRKEVLSEIDKDPHKDFIGIIDFNNGKDPEILAHEMGHAKTGKSSNPMDAYTKWRSKGREANKFRDFGNKTKSEEKKKALDDGRDYSGVKGFFRLSRRNRGVNNVLMEEENASKNARKDLKDLVDKNIMTESEYNKASKNLDRALDTYKKDAELYKDYAKLKRRKGK